VTIKHPFRRFELGVFFLAKKKIITGRKLAQKIPP